jgi:hypothetical protein
MAKEPYDPTHRLLREIRAKQDVQGATLDKVQKRVEDLYKCRPIPWVSRRVRMNDTRSLKCRFTSSPTGSGGLKQRPSIPDL